ncbi:hypothetical protein BDZ97DRAFT_1824858 [Flammula alnicola]|nr:hypothetical protein BDZ97DRAFT_1824858 [Flammula alnicola]
MFSLVQPTSNSTNNECSDPPRGQCTFYADCLEAQYHCGAQGYPIGYGQQYCEKFNADKSDLSPAGQNWMLDTMECLQRTLVPEATGAPDAVQTCAELTEKAFDSHPKCYIDSGLCWLGVKEWVEIVKIIGVGTLFASWDATKETVRAAEGCLALYGHTLARKIF